MDGTMKPLFVRQIVFIAVGFAIGLVLTIFFGPIVGIAGNMAFLIGIIFLIQRRSRVFNSFRFGSRAGGSLDDSSVAVRYFCLSCGDEVKGKRCKSCGSQMKRAVF